MTETTKSVPFGEKRIKTIQITDEKGGDIFVQRITETENNPNYESDTDKVKTTKDTFVISQSGEQKVKIVIDERNAQQIAHAINQMIAWKDI